MRIGLDVDFSNEFSAQIPGDREAEFVGDGALGESVEKNRQHDLEQILLDFDGVSANDAVHRYLQFQFSHAVRDRRDLRLLRCESCVRILCEVLTLLPRRGELLLRAVVVGLLLELVVIRLRLELWVDVWRLLELLGEPGLLRE